MYADPSLRDKIRVKANEYEIILKRDGDKLPRNQRDGLNFVIARLRQMAATQKPLKDTAFTEFRKLRETATAMCALPTAGEPRRFSAGLLSGGRVGGHFGAL